jgi:hypothetical protein
VARCTPGRPQALVGELRASLNIGQLGEVVSAAAERHEDVERSVRLIGLAPTAVWARCAQIGSSLRTRPFWLTRRTRGGARRPAERRRAARARYQHTVGRAGPLA